MVASCVDEVDSGEVRTVVSGLAAPGQRFHWRRSARPARAKALGVVADLPVLHLTAIATRLDPRRPERARRACLHRLLFELASHGVTLVIMETRTQSLNHKDAAAVDAFRSAQVIGPEIAVEHGYPSGVNGEPLLWVPDIIAGAIGAELDHGDPMPEQLAGLTTRFHLRLR
jgi:hypothetical protein